MSTKGEASSMTFAKKDPAFEAKKGMNVYLKILLNYLQMISIIQTLDLKWPFYVKSYLNVYSQVGGVSTQVLSFDCMLQDYQITTESIYFQTILTLILPFSVFAISMFILTLIHLKFHKSQNIRFVVILVVVSILLQPSIIKALFDNITCKSLDGNDYLKANMLINCSDKRHVQWVKNKI